MSVLAGAWRISGGTDDTQEFGTRLVERSLAQELSCEVSLACVPAGVVCTINAPLREGPPR
jgi:hypothetical protein